MSNATDESSFTYICSNNDGDLTCAESCVGLEECETCACATVAIDAGGPWGQFMDVLFGLLPVIVLVYVTVKKNPWPTTFSLPFAAVMLFFIRLMYYGSDVILTCGAVVLGLHEALSPISIIAGAMLLFETMEATKCMPYMMREMKALTDGHPISECMLIFGFAYMVEGASGFGTPVALGAPMLISTGHPKLESVIVLLIFNTFATVWGAVGTPIWFGFAGLATEEEFLEISYKSAICLAVAAFILVPLTLWMLVPFRVVKKNIIFIFLSLLSVVGPSLGLSFVSYEFPSLIGGMAGCGLTAILINFRLGLAPLDPEDMPERDPKEIGSVSSHSLVAEYYSALNSNGLKVPADDGEDMPHKELESDKQENGMAEEAQEASPILSNEGPSEEGMEANLKTTTENDDDPEMTATGGDNNESEIRPGTTHVNSVEDFVDAALGPRKPFGMAYLRELVGRTFPIWGCVLVLIITRIPQIGIRRYLTLQTPYFEIVFNTYGTFRLSASLVFQLIDILTFPNLNWKYELLYIPFVIPFFVISVATMVIYRKSMTETTPLKVFSVVAQRLYNPLIALLGALALVQLLLKVSTEAPAYILGTILAQWFRQGFVVIAPLLGALGSFFSGSTTVSNLTFGTIQVIAAESIGVSKTSMLALQAVGGSAGNGICLNNIIAACTIVGLNIGEGAILGKTYRAVFSSTTISTIVMLALFIRFK
ncbi:L-lactate permease [Nitzschia inconspicua]|uniref:L-lactate permease n=1 Tax=Nitzschia inconspicua TaxID=303405 RepID=A0A9K3LBK0_9STRA|nr:L-lactate permease [Nitzschia inconspicua]